MAPGVAQGGKPHESDKTWVSVTWRTKPLAMSRGGSKRCGNSNSPSGHEVRRHPFLNSCFFAMSMIRVGFQTLKWRFCCSQWQQYAPCFRFGPTCERIGDLSNSTCLTTVRCYAHSRHLATSTPLCFREMEVIQPHLSRRFRFMSGVMLAVPRGLFRKNPFFADHWCVCVLTVFRKVQPSLIIT